MGTSMPSITVLGDETGIVLSSYSSNNIRGAEFNAFTSGVVKGTGLHSIPSYSTNISTGMETVAGSCTWSGSGSGMIFGSGITSGAGIVVGSGLTSAGLVAANSAMHCALCTICSSCGLHKLNII